MTAEAAAFYEQAAAEGAALLPPAGEPAWEAAASLLPPAAEPPWEAAAAGPTCDADSSCRALEQLPYAEWEEQQAQGSSANSSWAWPGTPAGLPSVDYPAVAEAVCECLTKAQGLDAGEALGGSTVQCLIVCGKARWAAGVQTSTCCMLLTFHTQIARLP